MKTSVEIIADFARLAEAIAIYWKDVPDIEFAMPNGDNMSTKAMANDFAGLITAFRDALAHLDFEMKSWQSQCQSERDIEGELQVAQRASMEAHAHIAALEVQLAHDMPGTRCPECDGPSDGKRCEGCEAYTEHTNVY